MPLRQQARTVHPVTEVIAPRVTLTRFVSYDSFNSEVGLGAHRMKSFVVSILLIGATALVGSASAQGGSSEPHPSVWGADWRPMGPEPDASKIPLSGLRAMKDSNFAKAEAIFADYLGRRTGDADANLYMGVVKMNLDKWGEAKAYLETAATLEPAHPDPKIRLGITYAKLGDTAAALAQREALARMSASFRSRDVSSHVNEGIATIDKALGEMSRG
jgi:hypothetical protein